MLQFVKKMVNGNANAGFQLDLPGKHRNFNAQMKNWLLSLLLVFAGAQAFSQQDYFVYLQADNHQPFYMRLNDKVYSSTEAGYLILPRLPDTSYHFIIAFPANIFPEQHFYRSVNHKDAGYLLRNFGDKGWGLFNLLSLAVIMNSNPPVEKKSPELNVTKKTDAFSTLLANAVDDSSVLYTSPRFVAANTPAAVKEKLPKDTVAAAPAGETKRDTAVVTKMLPPRNDSSVLTKNDKPVKADAPAPVMNKDIITQPQLTDSLPAAVSNPTTVAAIIPVAKTTTSKVAELLTDTSYIAVYTDGTTENKDTIRVSIPLDKPGILIAEAPRNGKTPVYNMPGTEGQKDNTVPVPRKNNAQEQKPAAPPVIDCIKDTPPVPHPVAEQPKKDSTVHSETIARPDTTHQTDTLRAPAKPIIPNSTCINIAWDSDIDKLRVKMLAVKTDDEKIALAKKLFRQKCVTVKQIKALNEVFVTDEGKYKWFDAAYPSAYDSYNYAQLTDLIKDSYYQGRFRAMIRQ